jgi:hypothetical protein
MSQTNDTFNPFDPTGVLKEMRNANLESWSKMMIQLVNSDAYACATGALLDAWLTNSMPYRKATEAALTQALNNCQMPTRADVIRLAERLTQIETRLDDLEAKLEEVARPARKHANGPRSKANPAENPS